MRGLRKKKELRVEERELRFRGFAASILRLWRGPSPRACMTGKELRVEFPAASPLKPVSPIVVAANMIWRSEATLKSS